MVRYKFNDEAVAPHVEFIAGLGIRRNYLDEAQMNKIHELLKIDEKSIEELRAIRNSVVKLFSDKEDEQISYAEADRYHYAMNGVLVLIDSRIWDLGGNV